MMTHPTGNISPHTQATAASNATAAPPGPAQPDQEVADATAHDSVPLDHKKDKNVVTCKPEYLDMSLIRADGGTQARVEINDATVKEYAEALREGAKFPPVVLYYKKSEDVYWLADGFHRFHAHSSIGSADILAEVKDGTWRDAMLHAVGANAAHGLRRTNADKRRAVQMLLDDPECVQWSDNAIAKACGVSQPFVASVRAAIFKPLEDGLTTPAENAAPATRTVTRNGTTYQQKVKAKSRLETVAVSPVNPASASSASTSAVARVAPTPVDTLAALRVENAPTHEELADVNTNLANTLAEQDKSGQVFSANGQTQAALPEPVHHESDVEQPDGFIYWNNRAAKAESQLEKVQSQLRRTKTLLQKAESQLQKAKDAGDPSALLAENARLRAEKDVLRKQLENRVAQVDALIANEEELVAHLRTLALQFEETLNYHEQMSAILETDIHPTDAQSQLQQALELSRTLASRLAEAQRGSKNAQGDHGSLTHLTNDELAPDDERFAERSGTQPPRKQPRADDDMAGAVAEYERRTEQDAVEMPEEEQQVADASDR